MKKISTDAIYRAVKELWIDIAFKLPGDIKTGIEKALGKETNSNAREILAQILENAALSEKEGIPICQDTGFPIIFIERGQEVVIGGGNLAEALERAVSEGTAEGYLRSSIVRGPFERENTGSNTPPAVHHETVSGSELRITVAAKGAGSENASCLAMLKPGEGREGVKRFVYENVIKTARNACPPLVVGVGVGGTSDRAVLMAKKACLRRLDAGNPDEASFEKELLDLINSSGIGPGGFGGDTTALAVNVETFACHIASLPAAVNINCHAARRKEIIL